MSIDMSVLVAHVLEYVEYISPQMECVTTDDAGNVVGDVTTVHLSVEETLATWIQLPDSTYGVMFIGWLLAKQYTVQELCRTDIARALSIALTGNKNAVLVDYVGDDSGKTKLN